MEYVYLLTAGLLVSVTHIYLVWRYRKANKRTLSEYAVVSKNGHLIYFIAHVLCDVLILLYAYSFLYVQHSLSLPFYLFVVFAVLDFIQAIVPSTGKTEKVHLVAAYVSWVCYLAAGLIALLSLQIAEPYGMIATAMIAPVIALFVYMHIDRTKLYPYQLIMVPLYVVSMLFITIGAQ